MAPPVPKVCSFHVLRQISLKPTPDLNRNDSNRNDYGGYRKLSSNRSFLNPAVSEFPVCGPSSAKKAAPLAAGLL